MLLKLADTKIKKFALLILVSAGVGVLLYLVLPPLGGSSILLGWAFLAIGTFNVLLHRRIGRQVFRQSTTLPRFFADFWRSVGEKGVQLFYLGVGIVLAVIGSVFMIMGVARAILTRANHV